MSDADKIADLIKQLEKANGQLQKSLNETYALKESWQISNQREVQSWHHTSQVLWWVNWHQWIPDEFLWIGYNSGMVRFSSTSDPAEQTWRRSTDCGIVREDRECSPVEGTFKKSFGPADITVYSLQLQSRVQKKGEAFDHLARDLKHLGRKAYPKADEETLDALLKECFINAVSDEGLRSMIRFKEPGVCQKHLK